MVVTQSELSHNDLDTVSGEMNMQLAQMHTEFAQVRTEMKEQTSELLRAIYIVGLVQFIGIVGSVLAILSFMRKL